MISVFSANDYRTFINQAFALRSKNGFGESAKLARFLKVHNTFVSQVLKAKKTMSPEQAVATARYLGLQDLETDYFVLLCEIERAGSDEYRKYLEQKRGEMKRAAGQLKNRVKHVKQLNRADLAELYSDWYYTAIRLSTGLREGRTVPQIAKLLNLPVSTVTQVVGFLLEKGLIVQRAGELRVGPKTTHLPASSPWVKSHHRNWREKASMQQGSKSDLSMHYTAPMNLSLEDAAKVKEVLIKTVTRVDEILIPSESETMMCLNIDWFQVTTA